MCCTCQNMLIIVRKLSKVRVVAFTIKTGRGIRYVSLHIANSKLSYHLPSHVIVTDHHNM